MLINNKQNFSLFNYETISSLLTYNYKVRCKFLLNMQS